MRLSLRRRPSEPAEHPSPEAPGVALPDYEDPGSSDPLAEIATLMESNRHERSAAAERRLVQLRHAAFDQLDLTPPADAPDLSGLPEPDRELLGSHGLPEVDVSELTVEALRAGILGWGSLLVRGLLDPERAGRLKDGIDEAFAARDRFLDGAPASETTPWFEPFAPAPKHPFDPHQRNRLRAGGHAAWTPDSPRMMFELTDAFEAAGLTELIAGYLGEPATLSMNKSVLRRVSPDSGTDWHQDGAFLGKGIRTLNVWIAASRCGDVAPGMDIVARRFDEIVETGTEGAIFPWAVSPQMVEQVSEDHGISRPVFNAGDGLLFDHYCLHRTAVGPGMTEQRYATETWCFGPSAYPDSTIPFVL